MNPVHCSAFCLLVVKGGGNESNPPLRDMQWSKWTTLPRKAAFNLLKITPMPKANIQGEGRITEVQFDFTTNSCLNSTKIE